MWMLPLGNVFSTERTRISYFALLAATTQITNAATSQEIEATRGICSFCPLRNTSKSEHHHLHPAVAFLGMATRNSFKGFSILVPLVHHGRILP